MRTLKDWIRLVSLGVLSIGIACCAPSSRDGVIGQYLASYPFGTDKITLRPDGTMVQELTVQNLHASATLKSKWSYDVRMGYVYFDQMLSLDDGFGQLRKDWRHPLDNDALPVERFLFQVTIGSGAEYPYVKQ